MKRKNWSTESNVVSPKTNWPKDKLAQRQTGQDKLAPRPKRYSTPCATC
jgi:hypothetical protein